MGVCLLGDATPLLHIGALLCNWVLWLQRSEVLLYYVKLGMWWKPQNRSCARTRYHGGVMLGSQTVGAIISSLFIFCHYHDSAFLCMCARLRLYFQWENCFYISSRIPERGNLFGPVHFLTPRCDIGHPKDSGHRVLDCLIKKQLSSASVNVTTRKISWAWKDFMMIKGSSWENSPCPKLLSLELQKIVCPPWAFYPSFYTTKQLLLITLVVSPLAVGLGPGRRAGISWAVSTAAVPLFTETSGTKVRTAASCRCWTGD